MNAKDIGGTSDHPIENGTQRCLRMVYAKFLKPDVFAIEIEQVCREKDQIRFA